MTNLFQQNNTIEYFQKKENEGYKNQVNMASSFVSPEYLEAESQKTDTALDYLKDLKKWGFAIPYAGTSAAITNDLNLIGIQNKVKDGVQLTPEETETYKSYVLDMAGHMARKKTIPAQAVNFLMESLPYSIEFGVGLAASGSGVGLASLGQTGSKLAVKQALKQGVKNAVKETVKKQLTQTTAKTLLKDSTLGVAKFNLKYLPQQGIKRFGELELDNNLFVTPEGQILLNEADTNPATSVLKAIGLMQIETLSETAGYGFNWAGKGINKFISSKLLKRLPDKFLKNFNKLSRQVTDLSSVRALEKYGWNGILEEFGEERVSDLLQTTFDLDGQEGYSFEQFLQAMFPPAEQSAAELLSFALMGGIGTGVKKSVDYSRYKKIAKNIQEETQNDDGTYNIEKMKSLLKRNNPDITNENLEKTIKSITDGISKTEDYSVDDFLLDAGVFRVHIRKSDTDERLTEILKEGGIDDEEIENVLNYASLDDKARLIKMSNEAKQQKQDYSALKKELVNAGHSEEQADLEVESLNRIDEILMDKYNSEGEAENLIKNRNIKIQNLQNNIQQQKEKNYIENSELANNDIKQFSPDELKTDAKTFQYKDNSDSEGRTDRMNGVNEWNAQNSGIVIVWENNAGQKYIVDGHQRLGLAKRLNDKNIKLNGYLYREKDGYTPSDVRLIAAKKNIAEGSGTSIDTAKIIRELGGSQNYPTDLPRTGVNYEYGIALSNLGDEAFEKVVNGYVTPAQAAMIANVIRNDYQKQSVAIDVVAQEDINTLPEVELMARQILSTPTETFEQTNLFGTEQIVQSFAMEKVKIINAAIKELSKSKNLMAHLANNTKAIEENGNILNAKNNEELKRQSEQAIEVIKKLSFLEGNISTKANELAKQVKAGEISLNKAVMEFCNFCMQDNILDIAFGNTKQNNQNTISQKTFLKAREVLNALKKIVNGSEEETVENLRDDLEQYGGTNDVTFVFGNNKKGIQHIAQKHGSKTLLKVFDTVVDGKVKRYVKGNKTIILGKENYEAVLSLDKNGSKKTWLLSGWNIKDNKKSSDVNGEVSTQSITTQNLPTFSRQDLGAELSNIITDNTNNFNPDNIFFQSASETYYKKDFTDYVTFFNTSEELYYSENQKEKQDFVENVINSLPMKNYIDTIDIKQSKQSFSTYIEVAYNSFERNTENQDLDEEQMPTYIIRISDHIPTTNVANCDVYIYFNESKEDIHNKFNEYLLPKLTSDIEYAQKQQNNQNNKTFADLFPLSPKTDNNPNIFYQSAYHGTPYDFDEFSTENIGTGEGAIAHGWGLYFAENKQLSENYRKKLSNKNSSKYSGQEISDTINGYVYDETGDAVFSDYENQYALQTAINQLKNFDGNKEAAIENAQKNLDWAKDNYKEGYELYKKVLYILKNHNIEVNQGQLYEVDIPENDVLLDEDKTFSEQSDKVKNSLKNIFNDTNIDKDILKEEIERLEYEIETLENEDGTDFDYQEYQIEEKQKELEKLKLQLSIKDIEKFNYTGKGIYNTLTEIFGSPKEASLKLNDYGIKGITYNGTSDGRCYVIFDDKAINILNKFYQDSENPRASIHFKNNETLISLMEGNDASSVMHELAHLYLHDIQELSKTNKRAANDLKEIYSILNFNAENHTPEEFREMHENFAKGFEAYLLNGQAPSARMKTIFEKFKEFLKEVYQSISDLNIEFSKDVQMMFDRLLTTDEEYEKEVLPLYEQNDKLAEQINRQETLAYKIKNKINDVVDSWKSFYDTAIIPMDTQLGRISPELKKLLRKHTFDLTYKTKQDCNRITPFLLKIKEIKNSNLTVEHLGKQLNAYNFLSYALNNRDARTVNKLVKQLGIEKEFQEVRDVLDELHDETVSVGLEVGYLESYYPRMVQSDKTGAFIDLFEKMSREEEVDLENQVLNFDEAEYSDVMRTIKENDLYGFWSNEDKAKLINTTIRGFGKNNIMLSRIGQLKFERNIDKLTPEQQRFYEPIEKALSNYVIGARKNIEERKFFGAENKEVGKLRASIKRKKETLREVKTRTPGQAKFKELNRLKYELAPIEIKIESISGELEKNKEKLAASDDAEMKEKLTGYINNQEEILNGLKNKSERLKEQIKWTEESNNLKVKNTVVKRLSTEISDSNQQIKDILGDIDHIEDSIGRLIVDLAEKGIIHVKDEKVVRDLLVSRFNSVRLEKFAATVRDASTIVTLNDITNAVTQITDLTFSAYKFGIINTIQGMGKAEGLTRESLGIKNIAEEFRSTSDISNWVNKQLKLIGLDLIDGFAKNTAINASIISARKKAKSNNKKFAEKLDFLFGEEQAKQVKEDLINGKITDDIIFIAFNDLADIQPITTDQMTKGYQSGYRTFYVLKTYSIKALDILRNECFFKIAEGTKLLKTDKVEGAKLISEGLGNIIKMQLFMWLFGIPQDLLKDLIANREFDIPDHVIDNIIIFGIFNRFFVSKVFENIANIYYVNNQLPIVDTIKDLGVGIEQVKKGKKDIKDLYVWSRVPIVGKLYYNWLGGKKDKRVQL